MNAPKIGLPTPKVGERIVAISFGHFKERGERLAGFTDPAKRMTWVKWDDGRVEGEFTKNLVREVDYPKTVLGQIEADSK